MSVTTTTDVVPASVRLAAKRAFVRTLTRGYAAAIPGGGITSAAAAALIHDASWVVIGANAAAWLLSPLLPAAASWLSFISNGVPQEYTSVVQAVPAPDADAPTA